GDSGELVPLAREEMQKIEVIAKQQLLGLRDKETKMMQKLGDKPDPKEELVAYADMIKEYEKYQKDFEGSVSVADAKRFCTPLQTALSNKRMRAAFSTGSTAAASAPVSAKLKAPDTQKEWNDKVKARTKAVLAAGGKARFEFAALKTRMTIQKFTDD